MCCWSKQTKDPENRTESQSLNDEMKRAWCGRILLSWQSIMLNLSSICNEWRKPTTPPGGQKFVLLLEQDSNMFKYWRFQKAFHLLSPDMLKLLWLWLVCLPASFPPQLSPLQSNSSDSPACCSTIRLMPSTCYIQHSGGTRFLKAFCVSKSPGLLIGRRWVW